MSQPAEPAALPPALVTKATAAIFRAQGFTETSAMIRHLEQGWRPDLVIESVEDAKRDATAALQAAGVPALLQELRNIAFNCKDCSADDYRDWARSRTRHTLRQVLGDDYKGNNIFDSPDAADFL